MLEGLVEGAGADEADEGAWDAMACGIGYG
jgi:hypothetical protein